MGFTSYALMRTLRKSNPLPRSRSAQPTLRAPIHEDEHEIRRQICRSLRKARVMPRAGDANWPDASRRLGRLLRQAVQRRRAAGLITPAQANRMLACTTPRSSLAPEQRRYCDAAWCPWCWYRRQLAMLREIWQHVAEPALQRRKNASKRQMPRERLAVGVVRVLLTPTGGVPLADSLNKLLGQRIIRKIQRAGRIRNGVAFVTTLPAAAGGCEVVISVLGITSSSVQLDQPQPRKAAWKIAWQAATARGTLDTPRFGPAAVAGLLEIACPFPAACLSLDADAAMEAIGYRMKRMQPLGTWRSFLRARPAEFPHPIRYLRRRTPEADEVAAFDELDRDRHAKQMRKLCRTLLTGLEISPRLHAEFLETAKDYRGVFEFHSPAALSRAIGCPVEFVAARYPPAERDGGFPDPVWLRKYPIDADPRSRRVWRELWLSAWEVTQRPFLAVVFKPFWATQPIALHNYAPAAHPAHQRLRGAPCRTASGMCLMATPLKNLLAILGESGAMPAWLDRAG